MVKKKIIVLGGSGFLGSHVADSLSANFQVTIIDQKKSKWIRSDQKFIKGDISNPESFSNILKKTDYVYNFAAISDIAQANKNPEDTVKVNVLGLVKFLNLCFKAKIKKYIHASTIYVSGDHGGFYKASKLSAESYVKEFFKIHNLKYCILRYGTLYGPRSESTNGLHSIIKDMIKNKKITYSGDKESMRDYIHVTDAARISQDILSKNFDNKTLIVSGPQNYKIIDILEMISEISGIKKIRFVKKNKIKLHSHYLRTPYSSENTIDALPVKYSSNFNVDMGQGLTTLIQELRKKY